MKNPLVESVSGDLTQLSPKDFPLSFARVPFLPGIAYSLADLCADFELGAECLSLGGLRWLALAQEWLESTLGDLGLSFDGVI